MTETVRCLTAHVRDRLLPSVPELSPPESGGILFHERVLIQTKGVSDSKINVDNMNYKSKQSCVRRAIRFRSELAGSDRGLQITRACAQCSGLGGSRARGLGDGLLRHGRARSRGLDGECIHSAIHEAGDGVHDLGSQLAASAHRARVRGRRLLSSLKVVVQLGHLLQTTT